MIKQTPRDYIIETPPFARETVKVMVRATRSQMTALKKEKPEYHIRFATKDDYAEGLRPTNLNAEAAIQGTDWRQEVRL